MPTKTKYDKVRKGLLLLMDEVNRLDATEQVETLKKFAKQPAKLRAPYAKPKSATKPKPAKKSTKSKPNAVKKS